MAEVNTARFIYFRLADVNDAPVTGRQLSDLQVVFLRDVASCSDALALQEIGNGLYALSYTPSAAGTDYVQLYDAPNDIRIEDVEAVNDDNASDLVLLDETYGSGIFRQGSIVDFSGYTLSIFLTSDWQAGNTDSSYAVGQTSLYTNGVWRNKIYLMHGTYTVALQSPNSTIVLAPSLAV